MDLIFYQPFHHGLIVILISEPDSELRRFAIPSLGRPVFPVLARSGGKRWMAFAELAEIDGDYAVAFEWPRPDFNVAAYEFVIGVMAVAFPLLEKGDWPPLWRKPPGRADVEAALSPLRPAFFLTGEGPRSRRTLAGSAPDRYTRRVPRGRGNAARLGVFDVTGLLEITEPDLFGARVRKGFGRAKAFGCGLMLLRRAP